MCPFGLHMPVCRQLAPACGGVLASEHHLAHVKCLFVGRAWPQAVQGCASRQVSRARGDESWGLKCVVHNLAPG